MPFMTVRDICIERTRLNCSKVVFSTFCSCLLLVLGNTYSIIVATFSNEQTLVRYQKKIGKKENKHRYYTDMKLSPSVVLSCAKSY